MARDGTRYPENESSLYQPEGFHTQEPKRFDPRARKRGLRNEQEEAVGGSHQLVAKYSESSEHGRDSGRKHSSTVDSNYFRRQKTIVAPKSSRRSTQPEFQVSFRGSEKVIDRQHTVRDPSHLSQSTFETSPPKGPSLDHRSTKQTNYRNRRADVRLGAASGRVNDPARQTRRQAENSEREGTVRDDFPRHSKPQTAAVIDELDPVASYHSKKNTLAIEIAQQDIQSNGASGTISDYPPPSLDAGASESTSRMFLERESRVSKPSRRRPNLPKLKLAAPSAHSANDGSIGSAIPGKISNGNESITPVSTSAMSISSGSTPPPSCTSSSGNNSQHRKICDTCKQPEVPGIKILVRCTRCPAQYHTSCHSPTITYAGADSGVDIQTSKCQRCVRHPKSTLPVAKMPSSIAKPSRSAESSEYSSENSATQISRQIISLTLSGGESESVNGASPQVDHRNPTRRSERLQSNVNDRSFINTHDDDSVSDTDAGRPMKRFKGNIAESSYHAERQQSVPTRYLHRNGNSQPLASGISAKTFQSLEKDREDWSRSSSIFSENRTLAVVIDNRSRSTSTSTNGKKSYQQANNSLKVPATAKDSQETPILSSRTRLQASIVTQPPPTTHEEIQSIVLGSDDYEIPPQQTHQPLPSEIKNSQEFEEELTDAPMSLDSTEVCSPHPPEYSLNRLDCNSKANTWGYELPWRPQEGTRPSIDPERLVVQVDPYAQQYPPSVGDPHEKDTNGQRANPEYREPSSPPYSPPPPDIPQVFPQPVNRAESDISPQSTSIQDSQSVHDDGFYCRGCKFYVENNGQYKDKLCGSCVIDTDKRRKSHQATRPSTSKPKPPKEPTRLAQPSPSTSRPRSWVDRHQTTIPPSPKIPGSVNNHIPAKNDETSKELDSRESSQIQSPNPVKKFQTSKDRVIERYRMTFPPEIPGGPNLPIPTTNLTNLSKRKRKEPMRSLRRTISTNDSPDKGKSKVDIVSEKPANLVKATTLSNTPVPTKVIAATKVLTATKVATTTKVAAVAKFAAPTGPARKFPSKPTRPNISPPTKSMGCNTDRPPAREGSVSSKRHERRGPALKNAGQSSFSVFSSDDDDDTDDGNEDVVKVLEGRLREQKGYTKRQVEKIRELGEKLTQSERERRKLEKENKRIQEKLEAAVAASQKCTPPPPVQTKKLKRLVQLNRNGETRTIDPPFIFTAGGRHGEPRKGPSMKELFKDYKFSANNPWGYPAPELSMPDPSTFRPHSWQKTPYKFWDQAKLMNIHLHRQLTRNRGPVKIIAQPSFDGQGSQPGTTENSRSSSLQDELDHDIRWPRGGYKTTFDAFMGIPENMVPTVKGANLGFRAGILNSRTRRLDRGLAHYRIRTPGDLMDGS